METVIIGRVSERISFFNSLANKNTFNDENNQEKRKLNERKNLNFQNIRMKFENMSFFTELKSSNDEISSSMYVELNVSNKKGCVFEKERKETSVTKGIKEEKNSDLLRKKEIKVESNHKKVEEIKVGLNHKKVEDKKQKDELKEELNHNKVEDKKENKIESNHKKEEKNRSDTKLEDKKKNTMKEPKSKDKKKNEPKPCDNKTNMKEEKRLNEPKPYDNKTNMKEEKKVNESIKESKVEIHKKIKEEKDVINRKEDSTERLDESDLEEIEFQRKLKDVKEKIARENNKEELRRSIIKLRREVRKKMVGYSTESDDEMIEMNRIDMKNKKEEITQKTAPLSQVMLNFVNNAKNTTIKYDNLSFNEQYALSAYATRKVLQMIELHLEENGKVIFDSKKHKHNEKTLNEMVNTVLMTSEKNIIEKSVMNPSSFEIIDILINTALEEKGLFRLSGSLRSYKKVLDAMIKEDNSPGMLQDKKYNLKDISTRDLTSLLKSYMREKHLINIPLSEVLYACFNDKGLKRKDLMKYIPLMIINDKRNFIKKLFNLFSQVSENNMTKHALAVCTGPSFFFNKVEKTIEKDPKVLEALSSEVVIKINKQVTIVHTLMQLDWEYVDPGVIDEWTSSGSTF